MTQKFIQLIITAGVVGALAYGLGYWHGRYVQADTDASSGVALPHNCLGANRLASADKRVFAPTSGQPSTGQASSEQATTATSASGSTASTTIGLDTLLARKQWYQVAAWIEAADSLTLAQGERLIAAVRAHVNKYDALAMRRILSLYLEHQPDHSPAYFLLADLHILEGMHDAALAILFEVMGERFSAQDVDQARREADRLINLLTAELERAGSYSELVSFWQYVSESYTVSDYYRLRWAQSLLAAGRIDEAAQLHAQIGLFDVTQDALDELAQAILAARDAESDGPNFIRRGNQLIATLASSDAPDTGFNLLVDTGANITSLSRRALRQLGAEPTGREVTVQTAGGRVQTQVFWVSELIVQGRRVERLRVLELPRGIPGLDGLLGTDVLHHFGWLDQ